MRRRDRALLWGALVFGGAAGLGMFTFFYARGYSYFSNDPRACANCHVMQEVYDRWNHSSHKAVAACNDCHTPHDILGKYAVKGLNGWNHSAAFTTGDFAEPIRIREFNRRIVVRNCLHCHAEVTREMNHPGSREAADCLKCHAGAGHGF